jgi:serine/threonine protein kinase
MREYAPRVWENVLLKPGADMEAQLSQDDATGCRYAAQLACGLHALHSHGVTPLRSGLDPSRVMVDSNGDVVIADYGLEHALRHLTDTRTCPGGDSLLASHLDLLHGAYMYLSPEALVQATSFTYAPPGVQRGATGAREPPPPRVRKVPMPTTNTDTAERGAGVAPAEAAAAAQDAWAFACWCVPLGDAKSSRWVDAKSPLGDAKSSRWVDANFHTRVCTTACAPCWTEAGRGASLSRSPRRPRTSWC